MHVVFCEKAVWGIDNGKEALATCGSPLKGQMWVRQPSTLAAEALSIGERQKFPFFQR